MKGVVAAVMAAGFLAVASAAPSPAQTPQATETKKPAKAEKKKRTLSPGQRAMRERQRKCGAEWRAAKAAGKTEKGVRWPQYWSACNKRLQGKGA